MGAFEKENKCSCVCVCACVCVRVFNWHRPRQPADQEDVTASRQKMPCLQEKCLKDEDNSSKEGKSSQTGLRSWIIITLAVRVIQ